MSSEVAIRTRHMGKAYKLFAERDDWLRQVVFGAFKTYYRLYWVLRDLDLEIRRGESVGIVGRNGSGKSTLLQLLCGISKPTAGSLEIHGRLAPVLALGSMFDWELTGRENILIGAAVLGMPRPEILRRLDGIAAFAGVGDFVDQPVKLYSSGMISRLAFAICAHVDADILLIDEALSVGDAAFQAKCMAFLADFKRNGTLIFVSHDLNQIVEACDRVVWIDRGRIRKDGVPHDVIGEYVDALKHEPDDVSRFTADK